MSILKTPQEIIHDLKKTMSGHEIAKHVECSPEFINKLANGERKNPRYQIVDKLREIHQQNIGVLK